MDLKEREREIQNEIEQNIRELERKIQSKTSKIVAEEKRGELKRINKISSGNAGDTCRVERPQTKTKQNPCELERKKEQRASKIAEEIREELERINRISSVFVDSRTTERLRSKIELERELPKPKTSKIVAEEVREELLRINEISSGNAVTTSTPERFTNKSEQNMYETDRKIQTTASKTFTEEVRDELLRIDRLSSVNSKDTHKAEHPNNRLFAENDCRSSCANLIDFMKDEVNKFPSVSNRNGNDLEETEDILSKTDFRSQYENESFNIHRHDGDENVSISKATSKSVSNNIATENISKPQKITLKIFHWGKITDIDAFLQQRIGKALKYQIHHIDLSTENCTDVLMEFPSKTASRNAEYLLHGSNGKEGIKVSFCHFNEKTSSKNENIKDWTHNNEDSKTKSEYYLESSKVTHEEKTCENVELQNRQPKDIQIKLQLMNLSDQGDKEKSIPSKAKITNSNGKPSNKDSVRQKFPTTKSSKQAKQALQKSNTTSKTKILCHFDKERNMKMKKLVNSFTSDTKKLLIKHNKELEEISTQISKIEGGHKKQKFYAVEDFERKKKEKEALNSKKIEMENHKIEFKSFLTSLYHNLTNMKSTEYNEGDLTQLETAFKVECERFSAKLPIYARRTDIVKIVDNNRTSVILGETGSGKSTQVIQYLFQTGRFAEGTIVCTQPRKVAAISLATRVAQELAGKVGHIVGYQVGLHIKKSKETKILYVTDHVLLNECLKDPLLTAYSCIIIDEAHERSIFTDLLLGMIKKCLVLRPELRVIITSATIDPDVFVNFFGGQCPVLSVSGRAFPVDITWSEEDCGDDDYEQKTLEKALQLHETEGQGDILAFLTSPVEVEKSCQRFENRFRNRNDFICLPLHGKLQANEQQRVFVAPPRGKRKIVFATNSAETSITIPGIKYVIDSGRIKEMQFDPKKNISSLVVTLVTKSSANQRSGRAGRTAPGKCFRLYSKEDYDKMNACSSPELLRVNLGQALLKLIELGVDPISFDFVESPPKDQLTMAMDTLESIGAVCNGVITELGKWIAKLPFQPIFGVLVHDALESKVGIEALVLTACCGSGGSFFYRSGSSEEKQNSDKMKIRFSHEGGDLMTLLNAYREWHKQPEKSKGKWCAQNYVNGKTIKAVRDTVTEVLEIIRKELKIKLEFKFNDPGSVDIMLQKMLFKTFKHNICHFLGHEKAGYHVIHKAHNVCLFPSSALPSLGLQPEWIVIEQILQINRDYGVNATPIPIEWINEGIKEGWLKEFGMEKAEQQKVKQILMYGLGDQSFRDFVGPRYVRLKELESTLQNTFSDSIVIVDTDSKPSEICVYGSIAKLPGVKLQLDNIVEPIKAKFKDEKSEQYLSSTKQGTRAIISSGCNVSDVLMPDEYKSVIVISDQFTTSQLTDDDVRQEFQQYGNVSQVEQFHYTKNKKNWGRVTFETSEEAEYAVEHSKENDIIAKPTGNARLQNEHRFRAKLQWCRRPSKCCGFVEFNDERFVNNILQDVRIISVGGTEARLTRGENNDHQIFVSKLNRFVNEEVLRNCFLDEFNLGDNHIVRVSVIRHQVNTSRRETETIERRLHAYLKACVKNGRYTLFVKPSKPLDFTFLAFASFSKIEEGENACRQITEDFRPGEEVITATVTLQSSLLVIRCINEHCGDLIIKTIDSLNKQDGTEIRHKLYPNGNCAIDINCDHIDTLHRVRRKLEKIIQGRKMTKQEFPNIHELFSRAGKYELRNIATASGVFILDDYRILEISIYGDRDKQEQAFSSLQDYLRKLSLGTTKTFSLRGPDKPFGILKQMFIRFGIDLGKLKKDIKGLNNLQIDLRHHTVSINGTPSGVEKTFEEIDKIIEDLRGNQNYDHVENEERQCAICLMEIEEGEIYRLEACGHPFCKTCILPQFESAVGNSDFPISCCKENCEELWAWRDLTKVALQSGMSVNNLVNRAVNCFVAKHDKEYKFCISPDCPSIYRVTQKSDVFCCCECEARTCTACHTQYHDGFTCDMVKEFKEDPSGLRIWMRKDPKNRKLCPNCDLPIEKAGGCDHMECSKCRRHICWVCLEHFPSSGDCYGHLSSVHGGFGGGFAGYL